MTTTFTIATGPLTVTRTFANDAKARDTLLAFYESHELGNLYNLVNPTNQQKLQAVLDFILEQIVDRAQKLHIQQARAAASVTAVTTYNFE